MCENSLLGPYDDLIAMHDRLARSSRDIAPDTEHVWASDAPGPGFPEQMPQVSNPYDTEHEDFQGEVPWSGQL
jgi:hypothetical protein